MITETEGAETRVTAAAPTPELNDRSFEQWKAYIRPRPEELEWEAIPWRPAFWSAVAEAQETEKPLLIWAMNGHPLALT